MSFLSIAAVFGYVFCGTLITCYCVRRFRWLHGGEPAIGMFWPLVVPIACGLAVVGVADRRAKRKELPEARAL
jgi:hypothetical protein